MEKIKNEQTPENLLEISNKLANSLISESEARNKRTEHVDNFLEKLQHDGESAEISSKEVKDRVDVLDEIVIQNTWMNKNKTFGVKIRAIEFFVFTDKKSTSSQTEELQISLYGTLKTLYDGDAGDLYQVLLKNF